jgi:hypothetical protein
MTAVALTLLTSSNAWADLKTFDVDPQYRQEIYAALQSILTPQGFQTQGRVELLPSGQLLVNATAETLVQVEQVLQTIRNRPAAATPRVDLRYWAVFGTRGPVARPPGTPPPNALGAVLSELERLHGDLQFHVIGTAALTSDSGQQGSVSGAALEVQQTAFVQGDTLNATIQLFLPGRKSEQGQEPNLGGVEVRTGLRRGEFVVLGQSDLWLGDINGPVFFIVHWPEG